MPSFNRARYTTPMVPLPLDVVKLLEAAASHPEGDAALFEGHLESVAALYQAHPHTLERLRALVAEPAGKLEVARILAQARLNPAAPQSVAEALTALIDPAAVITKASAMPNGLELLTHGPIETAAMQLGTHPFVVEEARQHLAARSAGGHT
jgi:hypothetical protein